ncbi:GyrI-like domain-containing protein [Arthrobacter sp. CAL618]|uniref:GyrI-like domain-containing protein n=1 Tax=Arthrobacter sp. CAL618 TaxID=1055770 RepID=UPI000463AA9A|nr:GyrI-like domain-containing protein [Arthrobacter sp. CAL618]
MNDNAPQPTKVHTLEQPVAVVRERVPMDSLTDFFGRAFHRVMAATQTQGTNPAGPPFALYHGMPSETIDVEAGFPIAGHFAEADGVSQSVLPETDAFEAIHVGPFDTLGQTYELLQAAIESAGLTPADIAWESYLTDPEAEPDPSKWITKVVWPVA